MSQTQGYDPSTPGRFAREAALAIVEDCRLRGVLSREPHAQLLDEWSRVIQFQMTLHNRFRCEKAAKGRRHR